ncbi:hypothetical protein D9M71_605430 [compost metagenome]
MLQFDRGKVACGPGLGDGRNGSLMLGIQHGDTLTLGIERRRRGREPGLGAAARGIGLIDQGLADRIVLDQLAAALMGLVGQLPFGQG